MLSRSRSTRTIVVDIEFTRECVCVFAFNSNCFYELFTGRTNNGLIIVVYLESTLCVCILRSIRSFEARCHIVAPQATHIQTENWIAEKAKYLNTHAHQRSKRNNEVKYMCVFFMFGAVRCWVRVRVSLDKNNSTIFVHAVNAVNFISLSAYCTDTLRVLEETRLLVASHSCFFFVSNVKFFLFSIWIRSEPFLQVTGLLWTSFWIIVKPERIRAR